MKVKTILCSQTNMESKIQKFLNSRPIDVKALTAVPIGGWIVKTFLVVIVYDE